MAVDLFGVSCDLVKNNWKHGLKSVECVNSSMLGLVELVACDTWGKTGADR